MPKYVVRAPAIWVDAPGGRIQDRKKTVGTILSLKASEAKAHVEAGRLEAIKQPKVEPGPEQEPEPELELMGAEVPGE